MKINWNKPNRYSMILAIVIYVATFGIAFYLGQLWGSANAILEQSPLAEQQSLNNNVINSATFVCDEDKYINAIFFSNKVELSLSDGRNLILSQAISASGARYANENETIIFWNKGDSAFIEENAIHSYNNCFVKIL
ncbi:MAG TPA: MliC family protein [Candidatus Pacearchaeota archaeon]|nr:MliC family protein [Candidatus Pacearchaeota archaeon]